MDLENEDKPCEVRSDTLRETGYGELPVVRVLLKYTGQTVLNIGADLSPREMDITDTLVSGKNNISRHGLRGGSRAIFGELSVATWRLVARMQSPGEVIWERDWDLLIILDACRADMMEQVVNEYDYLPGATNIEHVRSVGGSSTDFMEYIFAGEFADVLENTAMVTGNTNTRHFESLNERVGHLDEVWQYGWSEPHHTVLPEPITDRTISVGREMDFERVIAHYMQPHHPFVPHPEVDRGWDLNDSPWRNIWEKLQTGDANKSEVKAAYLDNLRYVLDHLPVLLNNFDAEKAVITADHGNLLGEWGIYGHHQHVGAPELRTVPWVEVSASDEGAHDPTTERVEDTLSTEEVDDQLRALGYK
jgi:hypothetical protein